MEYEERLIKKLKMSREDYLGAGNGGHGAVGVASGLYNGAGGNGLSAAAAAAGMYHHPAVTAASVASDPYLRMQWAVFELAAREASAFRPWNPAAAGSCKHREKWVALLTPIRIYIYIYIYI